MTIGTFAKQCALRFFIITTCVTAATALFGDYFMPGRVFGFAAFYSPLLAGLVGTLPSFVLFSRKELNLRQTIFRQGLNLILMLILVTGFARLNGNFTDWLTGAAFVAMVLGIYAAVAGISYWLESQDAKIINQGLKSLQNRK